MNISVSSILLYSIVGAFVLVYLPFLVVGYHRFKVGPEALKNPRAMSDKLPEIAQRATAAHQNSLEAFAFFTAAALMAYVSGVNSTVAIGAAIAFLVARLLYSIFYIANVAVARSLMFAIGSISIFTLFGLSLVAANSSV
ncbi:MAG: MAPEG family protein [Prochloraceae cyanobacterium]